MKLRFKQGFIIPNVLFDYILTKLMFTYGLI